MNLVNAIKTTTTTYQRAWLKEMLKTARDDTGLISAYVLSPKLNIWDKE